MMFEVKHCSIARDGREILSDVSFAVDPGDLLVLRGKNGAGKSSLLSAIMGLPDVQMTSGDILLNGTSILEMKTFERARAGIFLAHQEPPAIEGVTLAQMGRAALAAMCGVAEVPEAQCRMREAAARLGLDDAFLHKALNAQMSGGEKKRAELFQLVLLQPKVALLDEIDSGVDATTRHLITEVIAELRSGGMAFIVVTHTEDFVQGLSTKDVLVI